VINPVGKSLAIAHDDCHTVPCHSFNCCGVYRGSPLYTPQQHVQ